MEPRILIGTWFRRNWPLVVTVSVLTVGVGVLLMRSTEYDHPPTAEAAVVVVPGETVVVPGKATVVVPGGDTGATSALVSETRQLD